MSAWRVEEGCPQKARADAARGQRRSLSPRRWPFYASYAARSPRRGALVPPYVTAWRAMGHGPPHSHPFACNTRPSLCRARALTQRIHRVGSQLRPRRWRTQEAPDVVPSPSPVERAPEAGRAPPWSLPAPPPRRRHLLVRRRHRHLQRRLLGLCHPRRGWHCPAPNWSRVRLPRDAAEAATRASANSPTRR